MFFLSLGLDSLVSFLANSAGLAASLGFLSVSGFLFSTND